MKAAFSTSNLNQRFKGKSNNSLVLHTPPTKFQQGASVGKLMTFLFGGFNGIITIDFQEKGKTIHEVYQAYEPRQLK